MRPSHYHMYFPAKSSTNLPNVPWERSWNIQGRFCAMGDKNGKDKKYWTKWGQLSYFWLFSQSVQTSDKLYMAQWETQIIDIQKDIAFVIQRSQRQSYITCMFVRKFGLNVFLWVTNWKSILISHIIFFITHAWNVPLFVYVAHGEKSPSCSKSKRLDAFRAISLFENSSNFASLWLLETEIGWVLSNHSKLKFEHFSHDNIALKESNSSDIGTRLLLL